MPEQRSSGNISNPAIFYTYPKIHLLIFFIMYSSTVSYMTIERAMLSLKVFYAHTNQRKRAQIEASKPKVKCFLLSKFRFIDVFQLAPLIAFLRERWATYASVSKTLRAQIIDYWHAPQAVAAAEPAPAAPQSNEVSEFNIPCFIFSFVFRARRPWRRNRAAI